MTHTPAAVIISRDLTAVLPAVAAAVTAAALGALAEVAVPTVVCISIVAAIATVAAQLDLRVERIPNGYVLAILAVAAATILTLGITDSGLLVNAARDAALGITLSGAPVLFVIWAARPGLIGGGDWKLLAALGAALGLATPTAALIAGWIAVTGHILWCSVHRARSGPFAPALLTGYIGAIASTLWLGAS